MVKRFTLPFWPRMKAASSLEYERMPTCTVGPGFSSRTRRMAQAWLLTVVLVAVAQVGMRVDLHDGELPAQRPAHAPHDARRDAVLAAQGYQQRADRSCPSAPGRFARQCQLSGPCHGFDHVVPGCELAGQRRQRVHAPGEGRLAIPLLVVQLHLLRGGDEGTRTLPGAPFVAHRGLVGNGEDDDPGPQRILRFQRQAQEARGRGGIHGGYFLARTSAARRARMASRLSYSLRRGRGGRLPRA